ncbi:hypothetical protein K502DRAFT_348239 [Neoconidiobolus thromboides FSU 785]|nr:hypothetical protein K502DRAFT_348239 [Neoconidiobolus thromboides FSU 785]
MSFFTELLQDIESKLKETILNESPSSNKEVISKEDATKVNNEVKIPNEIKKEQLKEEEKLGVICKDCGRRTGKFVDRHSCRENRRKTSIHNRFSSMPVKCKDCLQLISGLPHLHICEHKEMDINQIGLKCSDCSEVIFGDIMKHKCKSNNDRINKSIDLSKDKIKLKATDEKKGKGNDKENVNSFSNLWNQVLTTAESIKDIFEPEKEQKFNIESAIIKYYKKNNIMLPPELNNIIEIPDHYLFRQILIPGTIDKLSEELNPLLVHDESLSKNDAQMKETNKIKNKRITFMADHFEVRDLDNPDKIIKIPVKESNKINAASFQKRASKRRSQINSIIFNNKEKIVT